MNWGKGIILALAAFACMMAWFMFKASQNPAPLVTEDYYGAELKYQQRIDEAARAAALSAPVRMKVERTAVRLDFPAEMNGRSIRATFTLQRPNDPTADRVLAFSTTIAAHTDTTVSLVPGRYNAALEWEVEGVKYFTADKIYVP